MRLPIVSCLFFVVVLGAIREEWHCGTKKFPGSSTAAEYSAKFLCSSAVAHVLNQCCLGHDTCYCTKKDRSVCDTDLCSCAKRAAQNSYATCRKALVSVMCSAVKVFGGAAYHRNCPAGSEATWKSSAFYNLIGMNRTWRGSQSRTRYEMARVHDQDEYLTPYSPYSPYSPYYY